MTIDLCSFEILTSLSDSTDGFMSSCLGQFSSVTSANVGIGPQNFLTFSFNPFATLV